MNVNRSWFRRVYWTVALPVVMLVIDTGLMYRAEHQHRFMPCIPNMYLVPERPAILVAWVLNGPGFLGEELFWRQRPMPDLWYSGALYTAFIFWLALGAWVDWTLRRGDALIHSRHVGMVVLGAGTLGAFWGAATRARDLWLSWAELSQEGKGAVLIPRLHFTRAESVLILGIWYLAIAFCFAWRIFQTSRRPSDLR